MASGTGHQTTRSENSYSHVEIDAGIFIEVNLPG